MAFFDMFKAAVDATSAGSRSVVEGASATSISKASAEKLAYPKPDSVAKDAQPQPVGLLAGLRISGRNFAKTSWSATKGAVRDPGTHAAYLPGRGEINAKLVSHSNLPTGAIRGVNNQLSHDGVPLTKESADGLLKIIDDHEHLAGTQGFAQARTAEASHFAKHATEHFNEAVKTGSPEHYANAGINASGAVMNTAGSGMALFTENLGRTIPDGFHSPDLSLG